MGHSEKHGLNGHQLYRSRKGKSTYEALITVRVIYDMARTQRDYLVSIFNDLKGCYDRVRPALNTVATRRIGLPRQLAICHAKTLRDMKHHVRTSFGISKEPIQWDQESNPGGLGQGNGGGCVSWNSQMLILEDAYEATTDQTVDYTNPDDTRKFRQWLVGFVDDNSILFKMENLGYETHYLKMVENTTNCLET